MKSPPMRDLFADQPEIAQTPTVRTTAPRPELTRAQTTSPAAKFRKLAEGLVDKIAQLRRPQSQNPTPKRQREYMARCLDGDNWERARLALIALADAWDRNGVSEVLRSVLKKDEVARLVWHGTTSNGHYHIGTTGEYRDKSPAGVALQELLADARGPHDAVLEEAEKRRRRVDELIEKVRFCDIPGFFPTPDKIIDLMIESADIRAGQWVLEPSAGIGSICDRVKRQGYEDVIIHAIERQHSLFEVLRAKEYIVVGTDFLKREVNDVYHRVLMNPPFENGADIDHVRRAFEFLVPGGRLVAIMSAGSFTRTDRKALEFADWIGTVGAEITDLPEDAFKGVGVFRQTGARCKMVVIDRG